MASSDRPAGKAGAPSTAAMPAADERTVLEMAQELPLEVALLGDLVHVPTHRRDPQAYGLMGTDVVDAKLDQTSDMIKAALGAPRDSDINEPVTSPPSPTAASIGEQPPVTAGEVMPPMPPPEAELAEPANVSVRRSPFSEDREHMSRSRGRRERRGRSHRRQSPSRTSSDARRRKKKEKKKKKDARHKEARAREYVYEKKYKKAKRKRSRPRSRRSSVPGQ